MEIAFSILLLAYSLVVIGMAGCWIAEKKFPLWAVPLLAIALPFVAILSSAEAFWAAHLEQLAADADPCELRLPEERSGICTPGAAGAGIERGPGAAVEPPVG